MTGRASAIIHVECHAPEELLIYDLSELPWTVQEQLGDLDELPCGGDFEPGLHCHLCPFARLDEEECDE